MYYIAIIFSLGLRGIQPVSAAIHHCRPRDCYDLSCYGRSEGQDGPHTIYPVAQNITSLKVSCDQETDGGGWIMYQRRVDGTVNFTRTWQEYKRGFGNNGGNTTELWLGNDKVYQMLNSYGAEKGTLRIEVDAFNGDHAWIKAYNVKLADEADLYRFHWKRCRASKIILKGAWDEHEQHSFKTFDKVGGEQDCLNRLKGGWWYTRVGGCGKVLINGEYINSAKQTRTSIFVENFKTLSLQRSRMMFRETNHVRVCDNPCKNGAVCVHVAKPTRSHRCVCKTEFCGPECELKNPCKNGGTCEYDKTTSNTTCNCSAEFMGPKCEDARPTTPTTPTPLPSTTASTQPSTMPPTSPPLTTLPTTPPTIIMPVVGGIFLLLILCGIGITAGVVYKRRQLKKQEEGKEKGGAAKQKLKLAEAENSESGSYQDYMMSMFGF